MEMIKNLKVYGLEESIRRSKFPMSVDTDACTSKATNTTRKLGSVQTGTGHDNFLKGIIVQFDWRYTNKLAVEVERYHWLDIVSSQSTMHKITNMDLDKAYIGYVDERMIEIMKEKVAEYNALEDKDTEDAKKKYLEILYSNPTGMYLTVGMSTNYQQLKTVYQQRKYHRLPEWRDFCDWCETLPMFKELVLGEKDV